MGPLLEIKYVDSRVNVHILDSTSVPFYNHDGANAKCSTNSHETDYSALVKVVLVPWTADADSLRTPAGGPVH